MLNLCINFHTYLIFYFLSHQLFYECFLGGEQPNFLYFKCLQLCDTDIRQDELMLLPKQIFESCSVAFPWNEDMIFYQIQFILYHLSVLLQEKLLFFSYYEWYIFKCILFSSIYMMIESKKKKKKKKKKRAAEGIDFFFQVQVCENENYFYVRSNSLRYAIHTYNLIMPL